jgi:hypothetical protein
MAFILRILVSRRCRTGVVWHHSHGNCPCPTWVGAPEVRRR